MEPTHRLIATSIESAIQIVRHVSTCLITGRSVTALTSFTPKVASTSTVFFKFAPPEQPIATAVSQGQSRSVTQCGRLSGLRVSVCVATGIAPQSGLAYKAPASTGSIHQPQHRKSDAVLILFTCTASIQPRLTTALLTEPDRPCLSLHNSQSHRRAMANTITGAIIRHRHEVTWVCRSVFEPKPSSVQPKAMRSITTAIG